jgi:hypothetical protein
VLSSSLLCVLYVFSDAKVLLVLLQCTVYLIHIAVCLVRWDMIGDKLTY